MFSDKKNIFVTGSAGFIGFHVCKLLLNEGINVLGYDAMTDYYDVNLKKDRNSILLKSSNFQNITGRLENKDLLLDTIKTFDPKIVIHLAAQAGVRYSIENPESYINSNIIGTFNLLDILKKRDVEHFLMASTSSVYGANEELPFVEHQKTDHQISFYAVTKKSNELMTHSYSHMYLLPTTMFRFFTVYGPWGRPDMALFKFTKKILENEPIDVYNYGKMKRDFTYVDDIVKAICLLMNEPPVNIRTNKKLHSNDTLSKVAPWRVVNIGNTKPVELMDYVRAIEKELNMKSKINYLPLQTGDVPETFSNVDLLKYLTGFKPDTDINHGVKQFINWYKSYYEK